MAKPSDSDARAVQICGRIACVCDAYARLVRMRAVRMRVVSRREPRGAYNSLGQYLNIGVSADAAILQ